MGRLSSLTRAELGGDSHESVRAHSTDAGPRLRPGPSSDYDDCPEGAREHWQMDRQDDDDLLGDCYPNDCSWNTVAT
jgi:hypothetical protein